MKMRTLAAAALAAATLTIGGGAAAFASTPAPVPPPGAGAALHLFTCENGVITEKTVEPGDIRTTSPSETLTLDGAPAEGAIPRTFTPALPLPDGAEPGFFTQVAPSGVAADDAGGTLTTTPRVFPKPGESCADAVPAIPAKPAR